MSDAVIEQRERWKRRDRAAEMAQSLIGESRVLVRGGWPPGSARYR